MYRTEATASPNVTVLLKAWCDGDRSALVPLIDLTYPELHAIAKRYFQRERSGHTLQCTALINEAYLRLVNSPEGQWNDRAHFFAVAAHVMRSILVDHARARLTAKRGAGAISITLADHHLKGEPPPVDVIDLHRALEALEKLDPEQGHVVELRYFGGLSIEETAQVLGVSASTVKRDWILAKTWIRRQLLAPGASE